MVYGTGIATRRPQHIDSVQGVLSMGMPSCESLHFTSSSPEWATPAQRGKIGFERPSRVCVRGKPRQHLAVREHLGDKRWSGRRVLLSARCRTRGSGTGAGRYIAVASASTLPQVSTVGLLASRSIPAGAANRRLSSFECHSNPLRVTSLFAAVPGNRHPDFQHPSCRPFCPFFAPFAVP